MIIKNYRELAVGGLKSQVLDILEMGIESVEPRRMLSSLLSYNEDFNSVKVFNNSYDMMRGRIFVIGGGKSAGAMAEAVERIIGPREISAGLVACKDSGYRTRKIKVIKAGHPFPNWWSYYAGKRILALRDKYDIGQGDLVLVLISGGASSLLVYPVDSISLGDKQKTAKLLLESGADIDDVNKVRKHLSRIKGGGLANFFAPAKLVSLVVSDVIGDKLEAVGSGPTVPDSSNFQDALTVLEKYNIKDKVPASVLEHFNKGLGDFSLETPKVLSNADNYVVGNNKKALESMAFRATSLGLRPVIVSNEVMGDPNAMAYKIVRHILQGKFDGYDVLLYAGETSPRLPEKHGRGGRNQQFVAACILALSHLKAKWAMGSVSTDGIDYDLKVAGAIVDSDTLHQAERRGIDVAKYVRGYDTYNLFKKMGNSLIKTGHTGANVADIMVFRIEQ